MIIKLPPGPEGGPKRKFGLYDDRHCLTLPDMLNEETDLDFLALPAGHRIKEFGVGARHRLARRLMLDFLGRLIDHLIETGDHFQLPVGRHARLRVLAKSPQAAASILRRGRYPQVDVLRAGGLIYELVFEFDRYGKKHRRILHVDYQRYQRLIEKVNQGKRYDSWTPPPKA